MDIPILARALGGATLVGISGLGYGALLPRPRDEAVGLETPWALGIGLLSTAVMLLGLLGQLGRVAVGLVVAAGIVALLLPAARARLRRDRRPGRTQCLALLLFSPALLLSLLPPTTFDALVYHLTLPAVYRQQGSIATIPSTIFSYFPQTVEMLYLACLSVVGVPDGCAAIHVLMGALATLAASNLAAQLAGSDCAGPAALVFASTPAVLLLASEPKNDVAVVLFLSIAVGLALRALETGSVPPLLGLAFGYALATKHTALYLSAAFLLPWALQVVRRRAIGLKPLLLTMIIALAVAGPWYARAYLASGNPVYPGLEGVFGVSPLQRQGFELPLQRREFPLSSLLLMPVRASWGIEGQGTAANIGPFFLLFVPVALLLRAKVKHGGILLTFCGLAMLSWWRTVRVARFLLPVLPAAGVFAAAGIAVLRRRHERLSPLVSIALALLVASNLAWFLADATVGCDPVPYVVGRESREEYLRRMLPPYGTIEFANRYLADDVKILFVGETRGLYLERAFVASPTAYDKVRIVELVKASRDLPELLSRLRTEGYTHVLYSPAEARRLWVYPYLYFTSLREWRLYGNLIATLGRNELHEERGVYLLAVPQPES